MKNKISLAFLMSAKLWASSVEHMDPQLNDLYDKLSNQNIILPLTDVTENFKFYNIDALGAFAQGTDSALQTLVKGLKPYDVFKKSITLQSLSEEVKTRFLNLPNMPQEIKETTENLCVRVFAYAAEAFGKEADPLFIYATRPADADDAATLSMEDFDYTDSLTRYRKICSMIKLLPLNHIEDQTERFNCLKSLANIGISNAQFRCGLMLSNGQGVVQDKIEAFKYFKLAADQGDACGVIFCESLLSKHEEILRTEGFKYYKLKADQKNSTAQYNCGTMLFKGQGVDQDKTEAFKYFKLAAGEGCMEAQFRCANMLHYGIGILKDNAEALRYCKLAAGQGHKEALRYLELVGKKIKQ